MISSRYAPAVCVLVALALVPTVIHSYAHTVAKDDLTTAAIPLVLNGAPSTPTEHDAAWGKRRFDSFDWTERRYQSADGDVLLTVLRSYDLKKLYHHPELDVAYGAGYLRHDVQRLDDRRDLPLHVLSDLDQEATAVYALHYEAGFVEDPIAFQVRTAGELLFSPRHAMTLLFARDLRPTQGKALAQYPSTRVLLSAIDSFLQSPAKAP